ncbi:hypothetical protein J0A78_01330 [Providencia rettgeri]|uniref:hypothetical protein n=1 Tax=Morganellaceae TaxID=1903414 RepID=UPI000B0E3804|nr:MULTISPECIES: hypothetical protein [Morganellaceae]MBG5985017.1 hypothetical protein [Proteus vulgaris]MBN7840489.1 hypothetical protein [Providencia rettgeri]MBN7852217.1 hypothetical protein [Providencia rettgeri]MBN7860518.1 hypothetical protein [Providencia rettgeri]MBN7870656.1 hypothetical protein [Providencia rettgeri]
MHGVASVRDLLVAVRLDCSAWVEGVTDVLFKCFAMHDDLLWLESLLSPAVIG